MKQKINKTSLIFPIITFIGAMILLLIRSEVALSSEESVMFAVFAVCAVLPLPSVLFLKTDISRFLKLQIIFTAVSLLVYGWYLFSILSMVLFWVGMFIFGIAVPVSVNLTCIILFISAAKREFGRKVLGFFTALLSTPTIYINIYVISACIAFCFFKGISGLANIG